MANIADYQILIRRNSDLVRIGEVDTFTRAEFYPRYNDVGTWILNLPFNAGAIPLLKKGNGIIVYRNGSVLMSGDVINDHTVWSEDTTGVEISGKDDNFALQARLCLPVPSGPPYTGQPYDVLSGVASTVMRYYVNYNAGPLANSTRRWAGLVLPADPVLGSTVQGTARFDVLIDKLKELATQDLLGFRVIQVGTTLEFQVYQTVDRTNTAVFSPLTGTLREFERTSEGGEGNYCIVGGGGEGTARTFYEKGNSEAITAYRRIEFFRDRRDTTVIAELEQSADQELARSADRLTLNVVPVDTDALSFQTHWNIGDRVSVVLVKESPERVTTVDFVYEDVIREVQIILDENDGETIRPIIGTQESRADALMRAVQAQQELARRISGLERR